MICLKDRAYMYFTEKCFISNEKKELYYTSNSIDLSFYFGKRYSLSSIREFLNFINNPSEETFSSLEKEKFSEYAFKYKISGERLFYHWPYLSLTLKVAMDNSELISYIERFWSIKKFWSKEQ